MSELTTADKIELETATKDRKYGASGEFDPEADRWTKYGNDRLYFNGLLGGGNYLDLETGELVFDGAAPRGDAEVDGDTLTVDIICKSDEYHLTFTLVGEGFETDEADDDDDEAETDGGEPELVADGGEDVVEVSDADIETAIAAKDDPDHPDATTVEEVRNLLSAINADIIEWWDEHQDAIDDGAHDIVHEDRDVIVLADSGHFWTEQFKAMEIDDRVLQSVIKTLQHDLARSHCDHSWSIATPVVVHKTEEFRAGEAQVLREIARRTDETGSVARAVDQLATEVHGWSKGNWATLTGRNPSSVTRTTQEKR